MALIQFGPLGHFKHITITTPIAHRLRLEKLLYLELSRSTSGYFKPPLDPGSRWRFHFWNRHAAAVSEVKRPLRNRFGSKTVINYGYMWRPWPLAKANGFILVWECESSYDIITGTVLSIIPVPLPGIGLCTFIYFHWNQPPCFEWDPRGILHMFL